MAYNNSQRMPNVSQYLANLNRIPSAADLAPHNDDFLSNDPSMDSLASLEFFDYEAFGDVGLGQVAATTQQQAMPQVHQQQQQQRKPSGTNGEMTNFPHFGDFQTFTHQAQAPLQAASFSAQQAPPQQNQYSPSASQQQQQQQQPQQPVIGEKRKQAQIASPHELVEEASRVAAEEDKRRRNTAASARFRVKKKQREQALEKQAKEMTDRVNALENKVQKLQMENKWLRELITDKKDLPSSSKSFETFAQEQQQSEENSEKKSADLQVTSQDEHVSGVGTTDDMDNEVDFGLDLVDDDEE